MPAMDANNRHHISPRLCAVIYAVKRLCHFTAIVRNKATARFKKRSPGTAELLAAAAFQRLLCTSGFANQSTRHLLAKILGHARK